MKRVIYLIMAAIVLATLALTGCAPKSAQATNPGAAPGGPSMAPLTQDYENALPVLNQLVVGTFKLEDTEQAVDAAQATELLPLWKAYRNMDSSTSSSPVEVQALLKQIRGEMTEEQLNAIAAMKLTGEDMMQLIQERGIDIARSDDTKGSTASRASERPAIGGGGGGMPGGGGGMPGGGGGMPGGGGGMPAGGEMMPGMPGEGTPGAERQGMGARAIAVPAPLYGALIELLQSKV